MSDALIGGGISLAGSLIGGSKASKGASRGAQQAEFNPYSIYSGVGSGVFDKGAKTGRSTLSDPYQSKRDYYLGQADFFNNQLGQFTPPAREDFFTGYSGGNPAYRNLSESAPQSMRVGGSDNPIWEDLMSQFRDQHVSKYGLNPSEQYGNSWTSHENVVDARKDWENIYKQRLESERGQAEFDEEAFNAAREGYRSPEQRIYDRLFKLSEGNEALEKSGLESRLFAQGMLGSTGGAHRINAQQDAASTRDLARQQQAVTLAEEIQNQIQNRGIRSTQQALGIDAAGLENLRLGIQSGGGNVAAGQITAQNAANQGGAIANAFSAFGDNFSSGGLFGQQGGGSPSSGGSPLSGRAASAFDYDFSNY